MNTQQDIQNAKETFVNRYGIVRGDENDHQAIALRSAINTAIRRNPTYNNPINDKEEVKTFWRNEISRLGNQYLTKKSTQESIIKDVCEMKRNINSLFNNSFIDGGIRISQCQKSLSIYMKYLWCFGDLIYSPSICPIDRTIIQKCQIVFRNNGLQWTLPYDFAWTRLNDINEYKKIIEIAQKVAIIEGYKDSATWELFVF